VRGSDLDLGSRTASRLYCCGASAIGRHSARLLRLLSTRGRRRATWLWSAGRGAWVVVVGRGLWDVGRELWLLVVGRRWSTRPSVVVVRVNPPVAPRVHGGRSSLREKENQRLLAGRQRNEVNSSSSMVDEVVGRRWSVVGGGSWVVGRGRS